MSVAWVREWSFWNDHFLDMPFRDRALLLLYALRHLGSRCNLDPDVVANDIRHLDVYVVPAAYRHDIPRMVPP